MGLPNNSRSRTGNLRNWVSLARRLYHLVQDVDVVGDTALLNELNQRTVALTHQVEHLNAVLEQADPQTTLEIVLAVRESVKELSIALTEQANRTSELLAELSRPTERVALQGPAGGSKQVEAG